MRRTGITRIILSIFIIFGTIAICSAQATEDKMCLPMHSVLKPPDGIEPDRDLVEFSHARHFSLACKKCHHKWEGHEKIKNCMTAGCHDLSELPEKTSDPATRIRYYKTAFHGKCISCHREMKRKNTEITNSYRVLNKNLPKTGPTGCVECH